MWQINYESQAIKFLKKLDRPQRINIIKYLEKITQNPRKFGKSLTGTMKGLWRYRVEDYRIICNLQDKELLILVLDIGHRSKVYKNR